MTTVILIVLGAILLAALLGAAGGKKTRPGARGGQDDYDEDEEIEEELTGYGGADRGFVRIGAERIRPDLIACVHNSVLLFSFANVVSVFRIGL